MELQIMRQKQKLRIHVSALRNELSRADHQEKSKQVSERLISFLEEKLSEGDSVFSKVKNKPITFAAYMPYRSEVNVLPVIDYCWSRGIRVFIPKVEMEAKQLRFYEIFAGEHLSLETGAYGIKEPRQDATEWDEGSPFDIMLVPGIAYDVHLGRLGSGGGYYDRFLSRLTKRKSASPYLVAAAFEFQVVTHIPMASHDFRLQAVITEKRVIEL